MKNDIVFYEDGATYVSGISGWVSIDGRFWHENEHIAKWNGCTHVKCKKCKEIIPKTNTLCATCYKLDQIEKSKLLPCKNWDGKFPIFLQNVERFFYNIDDLKCDIHDNELKYEELILHPCFQSEYPEIYDDYFNSNDGCFVPNEIMVIVDELNKVIRMLNSDTDNWEGDWEVDQDCVLHIDEAILYDK